MASQLQDGQGETACSPDPAFSSYPGRQRTDWELPTHTGEVHLCPPSTDSKANLMGHTVTDTPGMTFNQTQVAHKANRHTSCTQAETQHKAHGVHAPQTLHARMQNVG